jgi:DNA invertase Pin-like site-specific DNA recombinase
VSPTQKKAGLPFFGYVRVSNERDRVDEEGVAHEGYGSKDDQEQRIRALAAQKHLTLIEPLIVDAGVSGAKAAEDRGLGAAVEACRRGEAGGIIVAYCDRFTRERPGETLRLMEALEKTGARLLSEHEGADSSTPMGEMGWTMFVMLARQQWLRSRANNNGRRQRALADGRPPQRIPFGYTRVHKVDDDGNTIVRPNGEPVLTGPFVPHPVEAPAVRRAFEMRAAGASYQAIQDEIERMTGRRLSRSTLHGGTRPTCPEHCPYLAEEGDCPEHPRQVTGLLRSRTYLGELRSGEFTWDGDQPPHEALVDEALWQRAQIVGKAPVHNGSIAGQGFLVGLVRCHGCGGRMSVVGAGKRDSRYCSYACRGGDRAGVKCEATASVTVAKMDALVEEEILRRLQADDHTPLLRRAEILATQRVAAEAELEALLAYPPTTVAAMGHETYASMLTTAREGVEAAWSRQAEAEQAVASLGEIVSPETWATADTNARRRVARGLIEVVDVRKSERGRWDELPGRTAIVWRAA